MDLLGYILVFNILGSVISLLGGIILLANKKLAYRLSHYLSSFAAGALLGAVFFDLLPEAVEHAEELGTDVASIFLYVLAGILFFFLLERGLHWLHHHGGEVHESKGKPVVPLIVVGDTIHNFIDGVAIAATFAVSIPLGIVTTIAVGAHEIPQEVGDFGVMLKHGMSRLKIILVNILSASASIAGALIAFYFGSQIEGLAVIMLSITSGFFLYIALSDLIPEIHHENRKGIAFWETISLILGALTVYGAIYIISEVFHIGH